MTKKSWSVLGIIVIIVIAGAFLLQTREPKASRAAGGQVVVKLWDWGVAQQDFYDKQFEKFMEENPDIKIEHSVVNVGQYDSMLQLSMKSNNAPDIFWKPNALSAQELVEKGWAQPIDEFVTEKLKTLYPKETFLEGVCVFDGKLYSLPVSDTRAGRLRPFYWNKKLFAEAGLDGAPKNWSQMREYAKKLTSSGAGKYYGFILGGKNSFVWGMNVAETAAFAGNYSGEESMNYKTGKYNYDYPANIEAFELLLTMSQDGSIFPGVMSIDDEQARAYFATNKAAMIIGGSWNVTGWQKYPNLDYGVAAIPSPDDGLKSKLITGFPSPSWWMKKDSAHPEETWKVLEFLASLEFHRAYNAEGIGFSIIDEAKDAIVDPHMKAIEQIASEKVIIGPSPVLRNPAAAQLKKYESKLPALKATFQDVLMEAWSNNGKGLEEGLRQVTKARNELMTRAIALAQKDGVKITAADWAFPDFQPLADYKMKAK